MQEWLARRAEGARGAGWPLIALMGLQLACLVVFVVDLSGEMRKATGKTLFSFEILPETCATIGLALGTVFALRLVLHLRRRQAEMAKGLSVAAGAIDALMRQYFQDWALTPAECDVAGFTIKGYSISEVAGLRGSAEGTVKAHLNAIYRKAGVSGRAQLVSLLIEDLFRAPLPADPAA
jgi:DNA-binding CsgD family transcriptional regulator